MGNLFAGLQSLRTAFCGSLTLAGLMKGSTPALLRITWAKPTVRVISQSEVQCLLAFSCFPNLFCSSDSPDVMSDDVKNLYQLWIELEIHCAVTKCYSKCLF